MQVLLTGCTETAVQWLDLQEDPLLPGHEPTRTT